ncbi:putative membrane protein [Acinetobacter baumannii 1058283]|nr:putative membrane protein [Acinetobacter baumannii 1461963]EXD94449.1 putative membrane protein [Acinetobacter baumannii 942194]EXQ83858.1 putative membrane protein [Acinetobacter baumannii 1058283]
MFRFIFLLWFNHQKFLTILKVIFGFCLALYKILKYLTNQ